MLRIISIASLLFSSTIIPSQAFYLDVYLNVESDPNDFVLKRIEIDILKNADRVIDNFCTSHNVDPTFCLEIKGQAIRSAHILTPIKPSVNSFDVFDTIVTRDLLSSNDIFALVETGFPYPNFKLWREQAGNIANGTLSNIYFHFIRLSGEESSEVIEALMRFEIKCECNHTYIMEQNYNMVKDGDILVTDTYLPYDVVANILKSVGYNKTTNLYVSASGKSYGWMFKQLLGMYSIRKHIGDDPYIDVQQSRVHGISSEISDSHLLSAVEEALASTAPVSGTALALLLRRFRHRNPYLHSSNESGLFLDQAEYNIPMLLFISYEIHEIMRREGLTRLLLTTRQGCLLEKLFPRLYPRSNIETLRFASSRRAYTSPSKEYIEYVKEIYQPGKSLIFDLHGTFKSGIELFRSIFHINPRVHMFIHRNASAEENVEYFNGLTFTCHTDSLNHLEDLNVDVVGPLITFYTDNNGQLREFRGPIESYQIDDALVYHRTIDLFIDTVNCSQVADLVHKISMEAVATGAEVVCGSNGPESLSPLTSALLISDTIREILLRIIPCPDDVRKIVSEHVHFPLSDWMKTFSWPWGRDISPERLEWELEPWYNKQAKLLFIERGYALSGDEILAACAKYAVFELYLGRNFADIIVIYENNTHWEWSPASTTTLPTLAALPTPSPPSKKYYSQFRMTYFSHFMDIEKIVDEMKAERFDFIIESNIPCLENMEDMDIDATVMTILELLNQQLASLSGEDDQVKPRKDFRSSSGWFYGMHFDMRQCADYAHLQSYYSKKLRHLHQYSAAGTPPLVYMTYWIGNILVFRTSPPNFAATYPL